MRILPLLCRVIKTTSMTNGRESFDNRVGYKRIYLEVTRRNGLELERTGAKNAGNGQRGKRRRQLRKGETDRKAIRCLCY